MNYVYSSCFPSAPWQGMRLQLLLKSSICVPDTHYDWLAKDSVEYTVFPIRFCTTGAWNWTQDLFIFSPCPIHAPKHCGYVKCRNSDINFWLFVHRDKIWFSWQIPLCGSDQYIDWLLIPFPLGWTGARNDLRFGARVAGLSISGIHIQSLWKSCYKTSKRQAILKCVQSNSSHIQIWKTQNDIVYSPEGMCLYHWFKCQLILWKWACCNNKWVTFTVPRAK